MSKDNNRSPLDLRIQSATLYIQDIVEFPCPKEQRLSALTELEATIKEAKTKVESEKKK